MDLAKGEYKSFITPFKKDASCCYCLQGGFVVSCVTRRFPPILLFRHDHAHFLHGSNFREILLPPHIINRHPKRLHRTASFQRRGRLPFRFRPPRDLPRNRSLRHRILSLHPSLGRGLTSAPGRCLRLPAPLPALPSVGDGAGAALHAGHRSFLLLALVARLRRGARTLRRLARGLQRAVSGESYARGVAAAECGRRGERVRAAG